MCFASFETAQMCSFFKPRLREPIARTPGNSMLFNAVMQRAPVVIVFAARRFGSIGSSQRATVEGSPATPEKAACPASNLDSVGTGVKFWALGHGG